MNTNNILQLLKSGIWEDALIAFHLMKDWTMEDIEKNFTLEDYNKLNLGDSSHIHKYVKINKRLYMIPGGSWSIRFHETLNPDMVDIII